MEGRWAKLTLYAHLNKYIDIRKPIHPVIEDNILLYVECLQHARFLPATESMDDTGAMHYISCDWINAQKDCILTWYKPADDHTSSSSNTAVKDEGLAKYEQWKRINNKD